MPACAANSAASELNDDRGGEEVRHSSVDDRDEAMCIRAYLEELTSSFNPPAVVSQGPESVESIAARVFDVITSRDFCYLSKSRAAMYRAAALPLFAEAIRRGYPIHLFYDIGGGYQATVRPDADELLLDVGLAELLVLRQMHDIAI